MSARFCLCLIGTSTLLIWTTSVSAQGPKGGGGAAVVAGRVIEREEVAGQTFVGTLEPRRRSVVGSAVDGRVEKYNVREGQWVNAKEVVAELLQETTKIELRAAEAELAFRQAEFDEYENGALEEDKEQARAKVASAEAQVKYAKARYNRSEALFQRGTGITQEDMDLAFSNQTAAEQNRIAAVAALKLLDQWPRPEKKEQAKARVRAQEEAVNQLEDRLEKFSIKAPFAGYVVKRHTEVGAWITRGDTIVEIIEIDPLEVAVAVPEAVIPTLQEAMVEAGEAGLKAEVLVDAVTMNFFTGVVERIVPEADVRSRTFPVKLRLDNPLIDTDPTSKSKSRRLHAGMICHVAMPVGKLQKVMLVPKDALVLGGSTPRVIVADKVTDPVSKKESTVAKSVPVELGAGSGTMIQVWGDLKPGNLVVIRGNERLFPGQPLNIVKEETIK